MTDPAGKVLILVENLPVPLDRRVWMEAVSLVRGGYHVSVICPSTSEYPQARETVEGVHIYRHPLPPEHSSIPGYLREYATAVWSQWRLAGRVYREQGFDVIHACNPPDLMFLVAGWFKLFHGTRFLFDQHDLCPELYESKFGRRGLMHRLLRLAERWTYALADTVVSTNQSYRDIALTRGRKKPGDVFVVRSGPDLSRFTATRCDDRYKRSRRYLVGYLGVMGEFDGVDHLVRAAHELIIRRSRTDIHFCLIGSGPMLDSLKTLAHELGVADYLEFPGRIPDAELVDRLSACDVGISPDPLNALNDKSTMNKILEYMALGLPVVQYDLLEGRRSAGDASLYATPNDPAALATALEDLLADPARRERMGQFGRRRMQDELEWKYQEPSLIAAYRHALNRT